MPWLLRLIQEFDITFSSSTTLYYDNLFVIDLANNHIFNARIKRVAIAFHFFWDYIQCHILFLNNITSQDEPIDILRCVCFSFPLTIFYFLPQNSRSSEH